MRKPLLPTRTLSFARDLRARQTDVEHELWQRLRGGQLAGLKFRRQHPIPPYIADFYGDALKLVIELDGSQHTPQVDASRTDYLASHGISVLRFWDSDVLLNIEGVLDAIWQVAAARTLTPTPLTFGHPSGAGGRGALKPLCRRH